MGLKSKRDHLSRESPSLEWKEEMYFAYEDLFEIDQILTHLFEEPFHTLWNSILAWTLAA